MSLLTATITAFRYDGTATVTAVSPLGESVSSTIKLDNYVATIDVAAVAGLEVNFKAEAVGNRMRCYGLPTPAAAVEALVRETVFGWSPSLQPADPANSIDVNGGTDDRVTLAWADGVAATADALLATRATRIDAARILTR